MKLFTLWFMTVYPVSFYVFAYCWTCAAIVITLHSILHLFFVLKKWLKQFVCKKK